MNEIEKDLAKEIAEQKKIGRGVLHRATREKGFRGAVKFPYEYLTGKDKKEYMKPINETTIDLKQPMELKEFRKLSASQQKQQIEIYAHAYGYSAYALATPLTCSTTTARRIVEDLGLLEWLKEKSENCTEEKRDEQLRAKALLKSQLNPAEEPLSVPGNETTPAQPENAPQVKFEGSGAIPARFMRVNNLTGTDKPAAIAETIAAILAAYNPDEEITISFEVK